MKRLLKEIITVSALLIVVIGTGSMGSVSAISSSVIGRTAVAAAAPSTSCSGGTNANKDAVLGGVQETGSDCSGAGVTNIFGVIIGLLSYLVGALAIIMVVISGFKYITSAGEASKVASAKNTLIYALIGVAVAVLAQLLVHFVVHQAITSTTPKKTTTANPAHTTTSTTSNSAHSPLTADPTPNN